MIPLYKAAPTLAAMLSAVVIASLPSIATPVFAARKQSSVGAEAADAGLRSQASARWSRDGFTTRMVAVNGTRLFVAEGGNGPAVVLLHGYPQSGEIWHKVAAKLAVDHHVIVPDLRGMGLSAIPPLGYDLANVAEDIHKLVAASGQSQVAVVGHDWGGSVAALYALRYRTEVSRLAFLESALPGAGFEKLWTFTTPNPGFTFIPFLLMGEGEGSEDTTVALMRGHESAFLHHLWAGFTGDKASAPFAEWAPYVAAMQRPGLIASSSSYYRAVYTSAGQVSTLISTAPLGIPVLALGGERSIGSKLETLVRAFASNVVRVVVMPGAGHFLPEERAEAVAGELKAFLAPERAIQ
jgi:pimeloyl-ACP methyl ester carboxylesterase